MLTKTTPQFRSILTLDNPSRRITIETLTQHENNLEIQKVLPKAEYRNTDDGNVSLIFHEQYNNGKEPCGWTQRMEAPVLFNLDAACANVRNASMTHKDAPVAA